MCWKRGYVHTCGHRNIGPGVFFCDLGGKDIFPNPHHWRNPHPRWVEVPKKCSRCELAEQARFADEETGNGVGDGDDERDGEVDDVEQGNQPSQRTDQQADDGVVAVSESDVHDPDDIVVQTERQPSPRVEEQTDSATQDRRPEPVEPGEPKVIEEGKADEPTTSGPGEDRFRAKGRRSRLLRAEEHTDATGGSDVPDDNATALDDESESSVVVYTPELEEPEPEPELHVGHCEDDALQLSKRIAEERALEEPIAAFTKKTVTANPHYTDYIPGPSEILSPVDTPADTISGCGSQGTISGKLLQPVVQPAATSPHAMTKTPPASPESEGSSFHVPVSPLETIPPLLDTDPQDHVLRDADNAVDISEDSQLNTNLSVSFEEPRDVCRNSWEESDLPLLGVGMCGTPMVKDMIDDGGGGQSATVGSAAVDAAVSNGEQEDADAAVTNGGDVAGDDAAQPAMDEQSDSDDGWDIVDREMDGIPSANNLPVPSQPTKRSLMGYVWR